MRRAFALITGQEEFNFALGSDIVARAPHFSFKK